MHYFNGSKLQSISPTDIPIVREIDRWTKVMINILFINDVTHCALMHKTIISYIHVCHGDRLV